MKTWHNLLWGNCNILCVCVCVWITYQHSQVTVHCFSYLQQTVSAAQLCYLRSCGPLFGQPVLHCGSSFKRWRFTVCSGELNKTHSVCLHAQLSRAIAKGWLGHLVEPLSLYTSAEDKTVFDGLTHMSDSSRSRYASFSWLVLDLLLVDLLTSQTSYKHVTKWLANSMSNGENMDNFTEPYSPYLHFTSSTN